jgi:hypothetical protein
MRRLLPFLVLAALLAGCGSAPKTSSTGGSVPAGASVVRPGVLVFLSLDSDTGSSQWQQLDKLAQKFPGRDQLLKRLQQEFTAQGVDYERDVKPALGPELDSASFSSENAIATSVALTKPDDPAKFKALVAKLNASNDKAVYREVNGWYLLSSSQAAITQALAGSDTLADDADFKQAMNKLPGDSLLKVYADGQRLKTAVKRSAATGEVDPSALGLDKLQYVAASVTAEDEGLHVHAASSGGPAGAADFASELIGGIPGDAFALLDFKGEGTTDQLEKLAENPQAATALARVKQELGVSYDQVLSLLSGEAAFYARAGIGIPEVTLALAPKDASSALATLDKIAAHLATRTGGHFSSGTQGGHPVKTLDLGKFQVHYGSVDGKVVVTSGVSGIADYGEGEHLADSGDFKEAKNAAGMPDSTGGYLYLDVKDALPLLETLASLSGQALPSSTTDNLRPVRSLLAWSNASGESRTYDVFLEIK